MTALRGCLAALGVLVLLCAPVALGRAAEPTWKYLWAYAPCNFQVDKNADDFLALMDRARKAGYNGLLVSDHKFGRLQERPPNYYANLERARKAAAESGMDLIPAVMPVGYSNSILQNNPNLTEGIAVVDCPMRVQGGKAAAANGADLLGVGGFEQAEGGPPWTGWNFVDSCVARDTAVKRSGEASARIEKFRAQESHGNGRVVKKLSLVPHRQYRVDVWIKTEGLSTPGDVRVAVLAPGGRSLNYTDLGVKATQDWREHHVLFNTLDASEVNFYVGIWGGREGRLWLDDIAVREVAGVNLLRREGCPVKVTSADGKTVYEEGRDFLEWRYPKMGMVPWPGGYEVVHPEPPLVLAPDSRIREGDALKVSFYHTVVIYGDQVSACLRHDEVFHWMEEEVVLLKKYLAPKKYFMSHDELRVAGQCGLCKSDKVTAGQVLAENVRRCAAIIRRAEPDAEIFVWSDMFDPNHNAVDKYYLVGSTLAGSWEGLDPAVRVMDWYFEMRDKSLAFFAGRGHRQLMAGYYDTSDLKANVDGWRAAAAKVAGVEGLMYTTWENKYKDLEEFARLAKEPRP
jgi:hypothetical protein